MASKALRQAVFAMLCGSPVLAGLGYDTDHIDPAFSPEGPQGDLWATFRWGGTGEGVGPVSQVTLQVWYYNRQPDFDPIIAAIKETRALIPTLEGVRLLPDGSEAVLGVRWDGDSADGFDDGYRAHMRNTSFTITASGS